MKFDLKKLLVWSIIVYLLFHLKDELNAGFDIQSAFSWLFNMKELVLMTTSAIAFCSSAFVSYWILFRFYEKRSNFIIATMISGGVLLTIGFRFILQEILQKAIFGFGNYFNHHPYPYILDNLYYTVIFTALGVILYFNQYSKYKDLKQRELILENQKTELALLRSQINPHFLFNTLNNIYTLIYKKSDLSLTAIERLTTLLRYALYEKEDMVLLQKEIKAVKDLVDLQTMRYDFEPALDIEIEEGNEQLKIPPFILIPFVENIFKHANLKNPKERAVIKLYSEKEHLIFYSKNEVSHQNKDQVGGIGLENIRKRLELIYGEEHELEINQGENFEVILKIEHET